MQVLTPRYEQCSSHVLDVDLAGLGLGFVMNATMFEKSTNIDQIVALLSFNACKHGSKTL
jgi:hypothetical protein